MPSEPTGAAPTRVLLVDDHRMFAELLRASLSGQDDVEVVGLARDGGVAESLIGSDTPDIVVLDYRLPGDDGVVVARRLLREQPQLKILMLTGHDDDTVARAALAAGCAGYVTKDRATDELLDAIRSISTGGGAVDADRLRRLASDEPSKGDIGALSPRELEVLRLLAEGSSTKEISERLFISLNTARNHVQRIIRKLGAHSRLEAVAIAQRRGITSEPRQ